jgi:hypothetical protein
VLAVIRGTRANRRCPAALAHEVIAALNARDWGDVAATFLVVPIPEEERHFGYRDEDRPRAASFPGLEKTVGTARVNAFIHRMKGRRCAHARRRGHV